MLIQRFSLRDIREYEINNRCSLLEMLSELSIVTLLDFIKLGNPRCNTDDEAGDILDEYLRTHTLSEAYAEIRDYLVGKDYIQNECSESTDTKEYKSLTDLYQKIGVELRTYDNLSYSEFWGMSVDDMYLELNILNDKHLVDKQDKINDMHLQAQWIAQALVGKLDPEPPQLTGQDSSIVHGGEYDGMNIEDVKSLMQMKAYQAIHNQGVKTSE